VLSPSLHNVSLPLLYPQNVVAWSHIRGAVADMGRSYYYRVQVRGQRGRARPLGFPLPPSPPRHNPVTTPSQIFTLFFGVYAIAAVVVLMLTVASGSRTIDTNSVASMAFVADIVFGCGVTAQIVQGARINRQVRAAGAEGMGRWDAAPRPPVSTLCAGVGALALAERDRVAGVRVPDDRHRAAAGCGARPAAAGEEGGGQRGGGHRHRGEAATRPRDGHPSHPCATLHRCLHHGVRREGAGGGGAAGSACCSTPPPLPSPSQV
jgi:hypothetical protein